MLHGDTPEDWPTTPVPTKASILQGAITDWPLVQNLQDIPQFVDRGTYRAGQLMDFAEITMALVVIPAGLAHPAHYHPEGPHVILVQEGHGTMRVGTSTFPITSGDVVLIPQNVVHMAQSSDAGDLKYIQLIVPAAD